jgi:hypothetical protein
VSELVATFQTGLVLRPGVDLGPGPLDVPPVGVEPTLGTLLGGRPLPLGYGGGPMIPPVQLPDLGVTETVTLFAGLRVAFFGK